MTATVALERVYLPMRLGELTLGGANLRMSVDKTHFLQNHAPRIPPPDQVDGDGHLVRSCPVDTPLPRLALTDGYLRYVPKQYLRHYIDLTMGWEAYQQQFSGKTRQTLRRKVRKFAKVSGGELEWRCYRSAEEIDTFHRLAREVSRQTYQERLLDAGLPNSEAFLDLSRQRAEQDRLRAYLLFLDDEPVAYLYCPARDGVLFYSFLGYRPDVAHLSPGTVLQWLVLESLFAEGRFQVFDFCAGDSSHKAHFGSAHKYCADLYFIRRRPRPLALGLSHAALDGVSGLAAGVLERLGVKQRIKRLIRRQ
ncbi:acetyltransferase (GNAT) family protein [Alkalispirillum mobile]|uniref:Acetyltransferase (GNAT) family protein n=1 Tax=Alkalispirillum mobile TaxID=85925 RepID=A0A498CE86_9GAMM|nr:GNAT family N-acetyltransferase [Alkalispirillum mobile]RLK51650.1 acetyltransferase (GNAT) family protein [Alkalispirillum mobile]